MRRFFYLFLLLILQSACSEIPEKPAPDNQNSRPTPVFEVFGYARCANCPVADRAADSLKSIYGDSVAVIEYHMHLLGDTISPSDINKRVEFYNIGNSAPITFINGLYEITGASDSIFQNFQSYFISLRAGGDSIGLSISDTFTSDSVYINIDIDSSAYYYMNSYDSIITVLTEDSIVFKQSGASDTLYNNVAVGIYISSAHFPYTVAFDRTFVRGKTLIAFLQNFRDKDIKSTEQRRF